MSKDILFLFVHLVDPCFLYAFQMVIKPLRYSDKKIFSIVFMIKTMAFIFIKQGDYFFMISPETQIELHTLIPRNIGIGCPCP